jgi:hypothetical protein
MPEWDFLGFVMPARFNLDMAGDVGKVERLLIWHYDDAFCPCEEGKQGSSKVFLKP